jgi:DNA mismatch repair protein MSH2
MVRETVDLDSVSSHDYVLLPSLDEELQATREAILETVDQLDQEHKRVGKDLGLDTEKKLHLENHQVHHYSLRITKAVSRSRAR